MPALIGAERRVGLAPGRRFTAELRAEVRPAPRLDPARPPRFEAATQPRLPRRRR